MERPNKYDFTDALNRRDGDNTYTVWTDSFDVILVYLRGVSAPSFANITIHSESITIEMYDDRRKRKCFKCKDYIGIVELTEAVDEYIKFKPRKTKPRPPKTFHTQYQQTPMKVQILNPNAVCKVQIVP